MRISYLILAHNTPRHMKRLTRALHSPNASFFIHVDRKSDITYFVFDQPNVTFIADRVPVYRADFSMVRATVKLIRAALLKAKPDYLCLLSGSDYPIKSALYIEQFFATHRGWEFMNLVPIPCEPAGKPKDRIDGFQFELPQNQRLAAAVSRLNRIFAERIHRNHVRRLGLLEPYGGSQWWALTAESCRHIVKFLELRSDVTRFFKNVRVPDESLFHTIMGNSGAPISHGLTLSYWSGGSSPRIINMDILRSLDLQRPVVTRDVYGESELLFARKFPDESAALTEYIDARVSTAEANPEYYTASAAEAGAGLMASLRATET